MKDVCLSAVPYSYCSQGDKEAASGFFWEAARSFTRALDYHASSVPFPDLDSESNRLHAISFGRLMLRRGLVEFGTCEFTAAVLDLTTASMTDDDAVIPMCALTSFYATCVYSEFRSPHTAVELGRIALFKALERCSSLAIARLELGAAYIAARMFDYALNQFELIPEVERSDLGDYEYYLHCAISQGEILRTESDYTLKYQRLFQRYESNISGATNVVSDDSSE